MISSKYIILLFLNIATFGYAQDSDRPQRIFDIKKFLENKVDGEYRFRLNDTTEIVQTWVSGYYLEQLIFNGSEKEKRYSYSADKGQLIGEIDTYCDELVGTSKTYNIYGELVKEINWDKGFDFTMDDLRDLIKKMFKVDILYPEAKYKHRIQRFNDESFIDKKKYPNLTSFYVVTITTSLKPRKAERLEIDGKTGEILSHIDENGKELINEESRKKEKSIPKTEKRDWTPLID